MKTLPSPLRMKVSVTTFVGNSNAMLLMTAAASAGAYLLSTPVELRWNIEIDFHLTLPLLPLVIFQT